MASAQDRLKVLENVIARVGLDGDVLGEYSKAMSGLNGLQTMAEMTPPPIAQTPLIGQNLTSEPQIPLNEGVVPPMGGNGLNGSEMA